MHDGQRAQALLWMDPVCVLLISVKMWIIIISPIIAYPVRNVTRAHSFQIVCYVLITICINYTNENEFVVRKQCLEFKLIHYNSVGLKIETEFHWIWIETVRDWLQNPFIFHSLLFLEFSKLSVFVCKMHSPVFNVQCNYGIWCFKFQNMKLNCVNCAITSPKFNRILNI